MKYLSHTLYLGLINLVPLSSQSTAAIQSGLTQQEMFADKKLLPISDQVNMATGSLIAASGWIDEWDADDYEYEDDKPKNKTKKKEKKNSSMSNTTSPVFARDTLYDGRPQKGLKLWGNIDYLLWWTRDAPVDAPLITSGSLTDPLPCAIGQPNTKVLFGNHGIDFDGQSGFRAALRTWFDDSKKFGLEASGLWLPKQLYTYSKTGIPNGTPIGVPFYNTTLSFPPLNGGFKNVYNVGEAALVANELSNPGTTYLFPFAGKVSVRASTELWDVELNGLYNFYANKRLHLSAILGALYADLRDELSLQLHTVIASGMPPPVLMDNATSTDHFSTHNGFFGGQLGVEGEWAYNWLFARAIAKVALGSVYQSVHAHGHFGDPVSTIYQHFGQGPGGIFTQATNIGHRHKYKFAVIPEGYFQFGVNILKNMRLAVGYNFVYISSVVRAGDQIDRVINQTQAGPDKFGRVPTITQGPARPQPRHHTTYYWAQGVNVGIEFRF